jgi:hypothetical protein
MRVKPLAALTRPLRTLLIANIAVSVAAVFSDVYSYAEYSTLPRSAAYSELFLTSDVVSLLVGLPQLVLLVAGGVVFLMWLFRTSKNLRTLAGTAMRFSPGWTVGWFFVPIANLFKPYQAVKEIWLVSHREAQIPLLGQRGSGGAHALVGWWWALNLLSGLVGNMAFRMSMAASDVAGYLSSTVVTAVSDAVATVGFTLTLLLVTRIAAAYEATIDETVTLPAVANENTWTGGARADAADANAWTGGAGADARTDLVGAAAPAADAALPAAGAALPPAAWHADPGGRHQLRWWDGREWTAYVSDGAVESEDPL